MPNLDLNIERLSFWLGFVAATLLWWVVSRIRPLIPHWKQQIRQYLNVLSRRNFASVDEYLRRETVRSAQRQHIASALFSLDELIIQPWLLVPPVTQDPDAAEMDPSIARRIVPYLPDWPEIAAPFGVPVMTPTQALLSGRNLAIIGHAGSGKTVALAQLASLIARGDSSLAENAKAVPIYLHVHDIDPGQFEQPDPLATLVKAAADCANALMQPQIPRYFKSVFADENRKVILLLDGLDELPEAQLQAAVAYLGKLHEAQPRMQMVVAASNEYLDGLPKAGFYPVALAAWSQSQRIQLMDKWTEVWNNQFLSTVGQQTSVPVISPLLMDYWLSAENVYSSPLEWTLRLWGAFAGDLKGSSVVESLEVHLKRFIPSAAQSAALEQLAYALVQKQGSSLSANEMEQIIARSSSSKALPVAMEAETDIAAIANDGNNQEQPDSAARKKKKNRLAAGVQQSGSIITTLIDAGILVQHANRQIRFASPVFLAFLASKQLTPEEQAGMVHTNRWTVAQLALHYAASRSETLDWVHPLITAAESPLHQNLLTAARWLRDAPANAEWRFSLMRQLATHIQNEQIPFSIRVKMIAAFYLSRDPSAVKLFKQLLTSKSPLVRRMALLGCGAAGSPQCIDAILALLADPYQEVRYAACMALAAIPEEASLNAVIDILHSGDEEIRRAAAEALALHETKGHEVLKEAAQDSDLLTRRASVYGLQRVAAPWAKKVLEQLAIEDGQWIVRNSAAQALDYLQNSAAALPAPLPAPSESPWLIAFASKLGMGVLPGHPATDVLLNALKSGSANEQSAALQYLQEQADDTIIAEMYQLLENGPEPMQEPVLIALWWIRLSGKELPALAASRIR